MLRPSRDGEPTAAMSWELLSLAAARAVAKLVFAKLPVVGDVSDDLVDIVGQSVGDHKERQEARRWLETAGELTATRLEPYLTVEYGGLPENERAAAVHAVAAALRDAPLDRQTFLDDDADLSLLMTRLRDALPDALLAPAARAFQRALLADAAAYVRECVIEAPTFAGYVGVELLQRTTESAARIQAALDRLPETAGPTGKGDDQTRFEVEYRRRTSREYDNLVLFGTDIKQETSRRYPLSVAYLTLSAASGDRNDHTEQRVDEILASSRRTLVRGEAGSGKTTLLRWLAVRAAQQSFTGPRNSWNTLVPVLVPLRFFASREKLPTVEEFLQPAGTITAEAAPRRWIADAMRAGRALVLIDGLDELPARLARRAQSWIGELCDFYPDSTYVVASRPRTSSTISLSSLGFAESMLQPLSDADVQAFVAHWHDAVAQNLTRAADERELREVQAKLVGLLGELRDLRQLAETPLLCAVICALSRDRRANVPRRRLTLYDSAIRMLVARRDEEREIEGSGVLEEEDARLILQDLAYWMLRNDEKQVSIDRFESHIGQRLGAMPHLTLTKEECAHLLLARSGLLREPVEGTVDFIHLTFQEYLAAQQIVDIPDIGLLTQRALSRQWDQTTVFAAGLAKAPERRRLLQALLYASPEEVEWQPSAVPRLGDLERRREQLGRAQPRPGYEWLALACLEVSISLEEPLTEVIRQRAQALMPPRNMREARLLASAGPQAEAALCELTGDIDVEAAVATVAALGMIGTPTALTALERWASVEQPDVVRELLRTWAAFDAREFAERVLCRIAPQIGACVPVMVSTSPQLAELDRILWVRRVQFQPWDPGLDIGALPLEALELLSIHSSDPLDTEILARATGLEELLVEGGSDWDDLDVTAMSALRRLSIADCSIAKVSVPTGLKTLSIVQCRNLARLDLTACEGLERLALSDCSLPVVVGTTGVQGSLQQLILSGVARDDIDWLGDISGLERMGIRRCPSVTSLGALREATRLRKLEVADCRAIETLDWLPTAGELTSLSLSSLHALHDISGIARLQGLEELELVDCPRLEDIACLGNLERLQRVTLIGCPLNLDFSVLSNVGDVQLPFPA
jgi:Leucine-rich repeat (LRR) protein